MEIGGDVVGGRRHTAFHLPTDGSVAWLGVSVSLFADGVERLESASASTGVLELSSITGVSGEGSTGSVAGLLSPAMAALHALERKKLKGERVCLG